MERNAKDITLTLNRYDNLLWIDTDEGHRAVIDNVTGIRFALWKGVYNNLPVWNIMSHGKKIGHVWDVKEIIEVW